MPFDPTTLSAINETITRATGTVFRIRSMSEVSGGCIHRSFVIADRDQRFFLKVNQPSLGPTLEAEAEGLHALRDASVRAPTPVGFGIAGTDAYLVLEHLPLEPTARRDYVALAQMVADLHDSVGTRFGWSSSNFIGRTAQQNPWRESWAVFFREARLAPQLELVVQNGYGEPLRSLGERVLDVVDAILGNHHPVPSLLHGDLWSGNAGFLGDGSPVLFDPAVYYGDREADIALTELFGGFPKIFYEEYFERAPLDEGYPLRRDLYNLYHVLNHLNLFGASYSSQAEAMMRRLLAAAE